jgi:hypothetical protein
VQVNTSVKKGGSISRSGRSYIVVHKGELDELGPLSA